MSLRWKLPAALVAVVTLGASALVAWHGTEKSVFVAACWDNGRPFRDCACTYHAYKDLAARRDIPKTYAALAQSWAHEPWDTYRTRVYSTVFWQSVRAVPVVRTIFTEGGDDTKKRSIWNEVARKIGEQSAKKLAEQLGLKAVPFMLYAKTAAEAATPAWDFAKARAVMTQHCGGRMHHFVDSVTAAETWTKQQLEPYRTRFDDIVEKARAAVTPNDVKAKAQDFLDSATQLPMKMRDRWRIWVVTRALPLELPTAPL